MDLHDSSFGIHVSSNSIACHMCFHKQILTLKQFDMELFALLYCNSKKQEHWLSMVGNFLDDKERHNDCAYKFHASSFHNTPHMSEEAACGYLVALHTCHRNICRSEVYFQHNYNYSLDKSMRKMPIVALLLSSLLLQLLLYRLHTHPDFRSHNLDFQSLFLLRTQPSLLLRFDYFCQCWVSESIFWCIQDGMADNIICNSREHFVGRLSLNKWYTLKLLHRLIQRGFYIAQLDYYFN